MIIKCEEDEETNEYFVYIYSMENAKILNMVLVALIEYWPSY